MKSLIKILAKKKLKISVVESCTGGLLASNITSTGATLTANISANGGSSVTAKGFVVSESSVSNPTLETNGVTNLADNNSILSLPFSFTKTFNAGFS